MHAWAGIWCSNGDGGVGDCGGKGGGKWRRKDKKGEWEEEKTREYEGENAKITGGKKSMQRE